jgi:hypothetical protein
VCRFRVPRRGLCHERGSCSDENALLRRSIILHGEVQVSASTNDIAHHYTGTVACSRLVLDRAWDSLEIPGSVYAAVVSSSGP